MPSVIDLLQPITIHKSHLPKINTPLLDPPLALHVKWALGPRYRHSQPPVTVPISDTVSVTVQPDNVRPLIGRDDIDADTLAYLRGYYLGKKPLRLRKIEARQAVAFGFRHGYVEQGRFTPYWSPSDYRYN